MILEGFKTQRLEIDTLSVDNVDFIGDIPELLSENTITHLPDDWGGINGSHAARIWLEQRLVESHVFRLSLKGDKKLVGLLLLYGLESEKQNQEARIGYVISEQFWGQGFASELIQGLLNELSKIDGIRSVVGGVTESNIGSVKVLTKNRFSLVEKNDGTELYRYQF